MISSGKEIGGSCYVGKTKDTWRRRWAVARRETVAVGFCCTMGLV
jgi:hypothetical protein